MYRTYEINLNTPTSAIIFIIVGTLMIRRGISGLKHIRVNVPIT